MTTLDWYNADVAAGVSPGSNRADAAGLRIVNEADVAAERASGNKCSELFKLAGYVLNLERLRE